eukprot:9189623-Alexandrium_andersonii.AAC.1
MECPWCQHIFQPPKVYDNIRHLENAKRPRKKIGPEPSAAVSSTKPRGRSGSPGDAAGGRS